MDPLSRLLWAANCSNQTSPCYSLEYKSNSWLYMIQSTSTQTLYIWFLNVCVICFVNLVKFKNCSYLPLESMIKCYYFCNYHKYYFGFVITLSHSKLLQHITFSPKNYDFSWHWVPKPQQKHLSKHSWIGNKFINPSLAMKCVLLKERKIN